MLSNRVFDTIFDPYHIVEEFFEPLWLERVDRDDRLRVDGVHETDDVCRQDVPAGVNFVEFSVHISDFLPGDGPVWLFQVAVPA